MSDSCMFHSACLLLAVISLALDVKQWLMHVKVKVFFKCCRVCRA